MMPQEKMVALVLANDGDDYANHRVYLVPAATFNEATLNQMNNNLAPIGQWLNQLDLEVVANMAELQTSVNKQTADE